MSKEVEGEWRNQKRINDLWMRTTAGSVTDLKSYSRKEVIGEIEVREALHIKLFMYNNVCIFSGASVSEGRRAAMIRHLHVLPEEFIHN